MAAYKHLLYKTTKNQPLFYIKLAVIKMVVTKEVRFFIILVQLLYNNHVGTYGRCKNS